MVFSLYLYTLPSLVNLYLHQMKEVFLVCTEFLSWTMYLLYSLSCRYTMCGVWGERGHPQICLHFPFPINQCCTPLASSKKTLVSLNIGEREWQRSKREHFFPEIVGTGNKNIASLMVTTPPNSGHKTQTNQINKPLLLYIMLCSTCMCAARFRNQSKLLTKS